MEITVFTGEKHKKYYAVTDVKKISDYDALCAVLRHKKESLDNKRLYEVKDGVINHYNGQLGLWLAKDHYGEVCKFVTRKG